MQLAFSALLVGALAAQPDPTTAQALSTLSPLGLGTVVALGTLLQGQPIANVPLPFFVGTALGMGGTGLGHAYGGNAWRGLYVGSGAYLATALGTGLGAAVLFPLMPHSGGGLGDLAQQLLYGGMIGGTATMVGYGVWAGLDARSTTLQGTR